MYVYGQLIRAAVETLGADPSTAADKFTGRLWYNTATNLLKYSDASNAVIEFVTPAATQTLTNKTLTTPIISTISNTGVLTLPTSTDTLVGRDTTDTLTNKTLTQPLIDEIVAGGFTLVLPNVQSDTLVGLDTPGTLSNKALTSPEISTILNGVGTLTLPTTTDTLVGRATTDALTNKDFNGGTASNTSRITVPKDVKSNLDGLTRKEATLVYATDRQKLFVDNGSSLVLVGSSGGGGSLEWLPDVNAPIAAVENGQRVWTYGAGLEQKLYALVRVPTSYIAGAQVTAKICMYSDSTSGDIQMQTVTTLIRKGVDAVTSTTNQRTSTNSAFTTSAGTVDEPNEITFDLSSTTGTINAVALSAGDLLFVMLTRATSGDTSSAEAKILPYSTEVSAS